MPARTEAARVTHTGSSYLGARSLSDRLVIVVNRSSDDTARMAEAIANEDGRLEVEEEPRAIGKGGAIIKGFEHVLNRCANEDVVCVTDADGAVPAGELIRATR